MPVSPAEAEARVERYRASRVRPDCGAPPPPGRIYHGHIPTSSEEIDLLHRKVAELHSTRSPEPPFTLAHPSDIYLDLPSTPRAAEPLAAKPENPIIERAAAGIIDIATRFAAEDLKARGIPFPPSEKYGVVFTIVRYVQEKENGRWIPQALAFDSTQFKTCSATIVASENETGQPAYELGTLTDAEPRDIVAYADNVFCTMSMLLDNRKKWLRSKHKFRNAARVGRALERSRQVEKELSDICAQTLKGASGAAPTATPH